MGWLLRVFNHLEEIVLTVVMICMTLAVALQIILRYVLAMPLDWSEELARFAFVWCIYMGASLACMRRKHLKIDAALFLLPRRWRPWMELLGKGLFLFFAVVLLYCGWEHFVRITWLRPQVSPAMRISMGIAYAAIPFSFGLMVIRLLQDIYTFFKHKEYTDTDVLSRIAREELETLE
jgi:TRAP-type C4-dicarboxylate transport system permease small subunit